MQDIKFTLQKRRASRKDYSHRKTLGTGVIPPSGTVKSFATEILSQEGLNECTAYAAVAIRESLTGKKYDPTLFWAGELALGGSPDGVTLDTQGAAGRKNGWTVQGETKPTEQATAYLYVKDSLFGGADMFDTLREAMMNYGALSGGLAWYNEWTPAIGGIIPHTQNQFLGGHNVKLAGLYFKDGIDYIILQNSWGTGYGSSGFYYLDRYMTNRVFKDYGVIYWITDSTVKIQQMGLLEALCVNVINLMRRFIEQKTNGYPPPPVPAPAHISHIYDWAMAIQQEEGWHEGSVSYTHNNPGNLKFSTLTASWGAIQGKNATDGGMFCKFPDYQTGFKALCTFLTLGAENELKAFHTSRDLYHFTQTYANPPNSNYALAVARYLKVDVNCDVSTLL